MEPHKPQSSPPPGRSILGGAAAGFSYEGATRDAVAREEVGRRAEAGHSRESRDEPRPAADPIRR